MAKLADAADLKSAAFNRAWGFKSPSGHHINYDTKIRPNQAEPDLDVIAEELFRGRGNHAAAD